MTAFEMFLRLLDKLDGLAGLAALVNGALLWPVVHALQRNVSEMKRERSGGVVVNGR